jgi:hypothetical protein
MLASGCVLRVVYGQLDWLSIWYIERYFELDPAQERTTRAAVNRHIEWHRRTQLPVFADLLREVRAGAGKPVSGGDLRARYERIVGLWDVFLRRIAPDAAVLLQGLTDDQVQSLFARLARDNEELAEDYSGVSAEERREKRDRAIVRAFERFTGALNDQQEQMIRRRTADMRDLSPEWLKRRSAWQQELRVLLLNRRTASDFAGRLESLFLDPNQFDHPGYRTAVEANQAIAFLMTAEILASLDEKQQARFTRRLTTYVDDLVLLSRAPAARTGSGES